MAVQVATQEEAPKKRRLPSPSQTARTPVVRPIAPANRSAAAKEQSLSRNFGQYARAQQAAAEEEVPDTRKIGRMIAARALAAHGANKLRFTGRKPSATLYGGVAAIALLKDMLDLAMIGSLPGIGTIVTICFTFLIWILLAVFDRSGGSKNLQITRGLVLAGVAAVEGLGFGLNFLPIQTFTVIFLYYKAQQAYRESMRKK